MRYDPATYVRAPPSANTSGHVRHEPVSTLRLRDRDEAMSRQTAEFDVWEDEDGTTAGDALEERWFPQAGRQLCP